MDSDIILLNGPSSSGKSTLAKELADRLNRKGIIRWETVSIDSFLAMSKDETIYEDDVFEISDLMIDAILEHLKCGKRVIVDHVITSRRIYERFMDRLAAHRICLVHVSCPLHIIRQREMLRGDRCIGSAEASFQYLYPQDGYNSAVDTFRMTLEECCNAILHTDGRSC